MSPDDGDRRNLTVMFCDLVDSTSLSERVDPEDMTRIVHAFTESTSTICKKYGGHVTRFLGDAVLCYFGYPQAYEDATRRAQSRCIAALASLMVKW